MSVDTYEQYSAQGKEVLTTKDRKHVADAIDESTALRIASALNLKEWLGGPDGKF